MAFKEIEPEQSIGKYWKPQKVGDCIEGNIIAFSIDDYEKKRIELYLGQDEQGEMITTTLPSHANLLSFIPKLKVGDYVHVELKKIIPPKEGHEYGTNIYKVLVDDDQFVEFEEY